MISKMLSTACAIAVTVIPGLAQTPMSKVIDDLHSTDPVTRKAGEQSMLAVFQQEFPNIEQETHVICAALTDKDPYVRQSMSAIYEVIATIGPEHNQVLLACTDGLIKAATDEKPRIRYNALIALSQNPAGPPPAAHTVLVAALESSDARARGISALGLLREGGHGSQQNEVLVAQALTSAQDSETRNGILHAISSANVKSQSLYDASAKFLSDGTPEIQQAAIDAIAASTQPAQAITALQNVASAPSVTKENKEYAVTKIEALKQTK